MDASVLLCSSPAGNEMKLWCPNFSRDDAGREDDDGGENRVGEDEDTKDELEW